MNKKLVFAPFALAALATSAQAITIATHADPVTVNNPGIVFTATDTAISASWMGTGLTLQLPGAPGAPTFTDVKMTMTAQDNVSAVSRTGTSIGAGIVRYWTTDVNNPIFTMTFDGGSVLEPFFTGSSTLAANVVSFGGSAMTGAPALSNEQFAFSFANPGGNSVTRTYTASMTSSADAVPEPASMALIGFGVAAIAARRKRA